jgi:hypothetical protein
MGNFLLLCGKEVLETRNLKFETYRSGAEIPLGAKRKRGNWKLEIGNLKPWPRPGM